MFIPQNNSFCVKVCKLQYLQNSTFKHKNKRDQFDIFCDGWDEDKGDIPDIMKSKRQGSYDELSDHVESLFESVP